MYDSEVVCFASTDDEARKRTHLEPALSQLRAAAWLLGPGGPLDRLPAELATKCPLQVSDEEKEIT